MVQLSVRRELVEEINRLNNLIKAPNEKALEYAIKCGELLIEAQLDVPKGHWVEWMRANLEIHVTTAFAYMRLARLQDDIPKGIVGIDPALDALGGNTRLSEEAKAEMVSLFKGGKGKSLEEIAKIFEVRKSTVWYWVSAKSRNRVRRLQRSQREQARRAQAREVVRKEFIKLGGPVANAYSLIRKAEQELDRYTAVTTKKQDLEKRMHALEALSLLYSAEDKLKKVLYT